MFFKDKANVFTLGERQTVISKFDEPPIIPHIADAKGLKFSYESIFKSTNRLLVDNCCSEYNFIRSFLGQCVPEEPTLNIFKTIMESSINLCQVH